ncbi:MAG: hypothetical protein N2317_02920 [Syntrophales bacterium]|nr:hypothetical protein [Syntrophales bacterium]
MTDKSPEEKIQEEILKEKAEVLGRTGSKLDEALLKLKQIEEIIKERKLALEKLEEIHANSDLEVKELRGKIIEAINRDIQVYNKQREYAKLRYYYLIVTREALGFRRHHRVEEIYKIPPKMRYIEKK